MWNVTWKSIISHKLRLFTTSLSIALGVAFVAGALMLGATMTRTFDDLFSNAFKNTDVVVRGASDLAGDNSDLRPPIDESLLNTVKGIDGVQEAQPDVTGFAQLVNGAGKPVKTGGAPQYGTVWHKTDLSTWKLSKGVAPANADQVVIDAAVAKKGKFNVGDPVTVLTQNGPSKYSISGIAKWGSVDSPAGAQFVLFYDTATAQKAVGIPGKIDGIDVKAASGVTQQQLTDRIKSAVGGPNVDVVTGKAAEKENKDSVNKFLKVFTIILSVFGGIALFVAAFIINNTFSIILAQRMKEMALLRAIGATRRQVLRSVMLEALATGLFASVVGLLLGIVISLGIQALLKALGVELPTSGIVIPGSAISTSLIAGTVITLIAAFLPARRSSKIPPIAALREVAIDESNRSLLRFVLGLAIAAFGAVLLLVGLLVHMKKPYIPVGFGAALVFIGVYFLGPAISRPLSRVIGWPMTKVSGQSGILARENAMRNPRRTSATASALMIGVALVTLASVFFTSAKESAMQVVSRSFGGDFIVSSSNSTGQTGVPFQFAPQLRERKEIGTVAELQFIPIAKVDGNELSVSAVNPRDFTKVLDVETQQGDINNIGDNDIAVSKKYADNHNLKVGDTVNVELQAGTSARKVQAIYKDTTLVGSFIVTLNSAKSDAANQYDDMVFVNRSSGTSVADARKAVDETSAPYLTIKVQDLTELKKEMTKQIDSALNIFYVLLALTIIIALIGIANTLALSVFERTRELGLLRAVGMTRWQTRFMVAWEAVIVALLGTLLGLIIGIAFGWALVYSARNEGFEVFAIPFVNVIFILLIAALAGIVSAILPARRASRIDVLRAIATE